jgi:hypothetical protein
LVIYLDLAAAEIDPRGQQWALKADERRSLRDVPFLRARLARHGRRPTHAPLLNEVDLLQARIEATSPDLGELMSVLVARDLYAGAGRILAAMQDAPDVRLPWCPWPGRRLPLNVDGLWAVIVRYPTTAAMSWLASTSEVSDPKFATLFNQELGHLKVIRLWHSRLQLTLAAVAFARPDRLERLRTALTDATWRALFERVDLLVRQLREGERGPLHPELARVYDVVRPR